MTSKRFDEVIAEQRAHWGAALFDAIQEIAGLEEQEFEETGETNQPAGH